MKKKLSPARHGVLFTSPGLAQRGGAHPYMGEVAFGPGLTRAFHLDRLDLSRIFFSPS